MSEETPADAREGTRCVQRWRKAQWSHLGMLDLGLELWAWALSALALQGYSGYSTGAGSGTGSDREDSDIYSQGTWVDWALPWDGQPRRRGASPERGSSASDTGAEMLMATGRRCGTKVLLVNK